MVIWCELCRSPANTYCESDQAKLCWSCDGNVHAANFLVAKHTRVLLCHHCQAPTPWSASGSKLSHSCSFCVSCISSMAQHNANDDDHLERSSDDEEDDTNNDDENQVVPWAAIPSEINESEVEDLVC